MWSGKIKLLFLKERGKHTVWKALILLMLILVLLRVIPVQLKQEKYCTILESRDGVLLGARIADDGQWRFPAADSVPEKLRQALVLFEDQYFFYHPGINPVALTRAAIQNIRSGRVVSGGSTITMQLARIEKTSAKRSIWNKCKEMLFSVRMEFFFSKPSILKIYLSKAPFGGNVVGLSAASWRYFGKDPFGLSWAEAATLAVLPNSPSLINPSKNRTVLKLKRDRLLLRMKKKGVLDEFSYLLAVAEPLPDKPLPLPQLAPHLLDRAAKDYPGERIISTIDYQLQQRVSTILAFHHQQLQENNINNLAALVINSRTGSVLAYLGNIRSSNLNYGGDVDLITSPRSTGSLLKPVLFAALLSEGVILPNTLIADIPTQIGGFSPKNYNFTYDGAVPAKRALARSLNIPAVNMLRMYGVERFWQLLRTLGMSTLSFPSDHYGLSLILGGAEGTLWDMCGVYASLARIVIHYKESGDGYTTADIHGPTYTVTDNKNKLEARIPDNSHAVLGAGPLYLMFEALVEVNRPDQESGWRNYSGSGEVAWKTGTSFGYRDAWAIGTTPEIVAGVWVGNASGEGRPGLTGIGTAAPVLFDILDLFQNSAWFSIPYDDLIKAAICRYSGHLASEYCDLIDTSWIQARGKSSQQCPYHKLIHLDPTAKYRVNSDCEDISQMIHVNWFVLPPSQEWYFRSKNPFYQTLPPLKAGCRESSDIQMIELITLKEVNKLFVPREIDGTLGRIVFQAAHRNQSARIFWHLDNEYMGQTNLPHQLSLQPAVG